jgi:hypothetical protein
LDLVIDLATDLVPQQSCFDVGIDLVPDLVPDSVPDLDHDLVHDLAPDLVPDLATDLAHDLAPDLDHDLVPDFWLTGFHRIDLSGKDSLTWPRTPRLGPGLGHRLGP